MVGTRDRPPRLHHQYVAAIVGRAAWKLTTLEAQAGKQKRQRIRLGQRRTQERNEWRNPRKSEARLAAEDAGNGKVKDPNHEAKR